MNLRGDTACVAVILLGAACGAAPPVWTRPGLEGAVRPEMGRPQPGDPAPDFTLPAIDGSVFRLAATRGSWVLLHFTATWCPYCDEELEHVAALARRLAPRGVRVLLVDVQDDLEVWRRYVRERVPTGPLVLVHDASGDVAARYAPRRAQPALERAQVLLAGTVVIGPDGTIRLMVLVDSNDYDPTLHAVVEELERMIENVAPRARSAGPERRSPGTVVQATLDAPGLRPPEEGSLALRLRIADGYHVMSNRPSDPFFVATEVRPDPAPGLRWGEPRYPSPVAFEIGGASIDTFRGTIWIHVPVRALPEAASGRHAVALSLRYQACTEASCLFPVTRSLRTTVEVFAGEHPR